MRSLAIVALVAGLYSPVAQLAEQVAVNHWVRCSNHRGGGDKKAAFFRAAFFLCAEPGHWPMIWAASGMVSADSTVVRNTMLDASGTSAS